MEEFDEFEMRPMTRGLGFQKDPSVMKKNIQTSGIVQNKLSRDLPAARPDGLLEVPKARASEEILNEIKSALKPFSEKRELKSETASGAVKLTETLPRAQVSANSIETPVAPTPMADPLANINFAIPERDMQNTSGTRRGAADSLIREWVPVPFSFAATFLDAMITLSLAMIFLVGLVSATQVDVLSVMISAQSDLPAQLSFIVLYLAMSQMYLIVSRSFAGSSVGEWTFDIQAGRSEQIPRASYPLRIFMRSFFTLVTGIVVLPILSMLVRKDIAGVMSGVRLYRRNI